MRQIPEIVHVQHRTMHDKAIIANFDAAGAGMQIDTLI
jgi:hypothetical protein